MGKKIVGARKKVAYRYGKKPYFESKKAQEYEERKGSLPWWSGLW